MSIGVVAGTDLVAAVSTAVQSATLGAPSGVATLNGASKVAQDPASKGVAGGVASLDGGAKVPSAQITGVLASSDLTNDAALEKIANKNAANGYAGLSAGSKVAQGQLTGVLASSDLTNDAALEKTANKNAANGYAGLSVGSKVALSQLTGVLASSDLTNDAALEKTANKNAANGYAGLSAGSKVALSQLTGVLASSDLTNDAALEKTTNKGAANGYASLDANTELASAQINRIISRWVKVTKTFSDFSFAGTTTNIDIFTLPAKGVINEVVVKHTTAFSGGAIATYTISVGISGNFTKYAAAFDVFQATGNTTFGFNELPGMENFGATTSIRAQATSTGANLNQAAAGSVDIYINYSTLP